MKRTTIKRLISALKMVLYMARWQLSTPAMTFIIGIAKLLGVLISWKQVAIANLICAPFFYFIDKFILVVIDRWVAKLEKKYTQIEINYKE